MEGAIVRVQGGGVCAAGFGPARHAEVTNNQRRAGDEGGDVDVFWDSIV
jgi:hypothetical protein